MFTPHVKLFFIVLVAAASAATYASRATSLGSIALGLLGAGYWVARRIQVARKQDALLHDPSASTLVFPPESKFRQSVLPPPSRT
jgi:hypothetical protein